MPAPKLSDVAAEYEQLFNTCIVRPQNLPEIEGMIRQMTTPAARAHYDAVSASSDVPWFVIAVIHAMECGLDFRAHLHNGDPLTARTRQVPAGRPPTGTPPFTWEESALDALTYDGFTKWKDWSIAGTCYKLEGYNGWGYRRKQIPTPYLWSYSNHYTRGKYIADGTWSDTAVSKQAGAAVILRRMAELSLFSFPGAATPVPEGEPLITYSETLPVDAATVEQIKGLQIHLNLHPGIFVKVDGVPGQRTSDAFRQVFGHYLQGDPREK